MNMYKVCKMSNMKIFKISNFRVCKNISKQIIQVCKEFKYANIDFNYIKCKSLCMQICKNQSV